MGTMNIRIDDGRTVEVNVESRSNTEWKERDKKDRAFFDFGPLAVQAPTEPRCTVEDCACGGRETDHKVHQRWLRSQTAVAREILALSLGDGFNFSRHAGCSCPCSPGYIAKTRRGAEHYVTVESVA